MLEILPSNRDLGPLFAWLLPRAATAAGWSIMRLRRLHWHKNRGSLLEHYVLHLWVQHMGLNLECRFKGCFLEPASGGMGIRHPLTQRFDCYMQHLGMIGGRFQVQAEHRNQRASLFYRGYYVLERSRSTSDKPANNTKDKNNNSSNKSLVRYGLFGHLKNVLPPQPLHAEGIRRRKHTRDVANMNLFAPQGRKMPKAQRGQAWKKR